MITSSKIVDMTGWRGEESHTRILPMHCRSTTVVPHEREREPVNTPGSNCAIFLHDLTASLSPACHPSNGRRRGENGKAGELDEAGAPPGVHATYRTGPYLRNIWRTVWNRDLIFHELFHEKHENGTLRNKLS